MVCFKCSVPAAVAATGHAMRKDWYETALPSRTVHLCEACYVPDRLAGKRTEAVWEQHETIWEAYEHVEVVPAEYGGFHNGWDRGDNVWDNGVRALENAA